MDPSTTLSVISRPTVHPTERTKSQRSTGSYRRPPQGVPFHPVEGFLAHLLPISTCCHLAPTTCCRLSHITWCHLAHMTCCRHARLPLERGFHESVIRCRTDLPRLDRRDAGCHPSIGSIDEQPFRAGRFVRAEGLPVQRPTIRPPDRDDFQPGYTVTHHPPPPHGHQGRGRGPPRRSRAHRRGGNTARPVGITPRRRAAC